MSLLQGSKRSWIKSKAANAESTATTSSPVKNLDVEIPYSVTSAHPLFPLHSSRISQEGHVSRRAFLE